MERLLLILVTQLELKCFPFTGNCCPGGNKSLVKLMQPVRSMLVRKQGDKYGFGALLDLSIRLIAHSGRYFGTCVWNKSSSGNGMNFIEGVGIIQVIQASWWDAVNGSVVTPSGFLHLLRFRHGKRCFLIHVGFWPILKWANSLQEALLVTSRAVHWSQKGRILNYLI